jgi:hypothetical protein
MRTYIQTASMVTIVLSILWSQDVSAQSSIKKLGLEESFKGFSWRFGPGDPEKEEAKVSLTNENDNIKLIGIELSIIKPSGDLVAIKPIVQKSADDKLDVFMWARNSFQHGSISFDCLWEVIRSSVNESVSDEQVFHMIVNALNNSDEIDKSTVIPIRASGVVKDVVLKLKKEEFIKNNKLLLLEMCKSFYGSKKDK